MKILMLCPLLSSSSMITVCPMAKALSKNHEVKLMGPLMGNQPFMNLNAYNVKAMEPFISSPQQFAMLSLYFRNIREAMKEEFDAIHAFKLLPHTGPVAAKLKKKKGCKFILSIDDYDAKASSNPIKRIVMNWTEKAYRNADAITVSSTYLQGVYGGDVLYQVPNEELFLKKHQGDAARKRLGLEGKKIVLYAGTFYGHKGLDVLVRAVQSLGRKDVALVLAGSGSEEGRLRRIAGSETIFTGKLPMEDAAELTAACDVYAIPTKDTEYARAEMPGKIFEPMMMGRPIVASRVSDIPTILGSGKCGLLTKPGDADSLAQSISHLIDNPNEAKRLAAKAKERYFENYCMKQFERKINTVYGRLEE